MSLTCDAGVADTIVASDDCQIVTQREAKCMADMGSFTYGKDRLKKLLTMVNNCTVLQVGAATIAARRFDVREGYGLGSSMYMHLYKAQRTVQGQRDLPWCWNRSIAEHPFDPIWGLIIAELHNITGVAEDFVRVTGNCALWHELGLDLVRPRKAKQGPPSGQLDELLEAVWVNMTAAASEPNLFNGERSLTADGLEYGIAQVLRKVYQAAGRLASQELSSADSTRSTVGAVLDSTVLLVAFFATATAYKDMLNLAVKAQCKLLGIPPTSGATVGPPPLLFTILLAKLLASVVVGATLVLSPLLVLLSEQSAQKNNPKGDESRVGWLSANTGEGSGPYTLVAAISVSTLSNYNDTAQAIVIANLVLACVAAACLAALVWKDELKAARVRMRKHLC